MNHPVNQKKKSVFDNYPKERMDSGYINTKTGHGGDNSRTGQTIFSGHTFLGMYQERELHRSDWVARKIIEEHVNDMFRKWIDFQEDPDEVSEETIQKINARIKRHALKSVCVKTGHAARRSGAGYAYFTFDDGATEDELAEPLNENRVSDITRIDIIDKWNCQPISAYEDPQHPKFGEPETYRLILQHFRTQLSVVVHESRLARFDSPISSDQMTRARNQGVNDGVLVNVYEELIRYGVTIQSVGSIVEKFFMNIYKVKGILEKLASGATQVISRMADLFHYGHNENTIMLDPSEEYTREGAPVQGLADLMPAFSQVISHASGLPLYKFWTEAGALGGDNHSGSEQDYHDNISYMQETDGRVFIDQLFYFLSLVEDFDPEKIEYEFNPLQQQSELEFATTLKTTLEAYVAAVGGGLLPAETVTKNMFSGKQIDLTSMPVDMLEWDQMKEDDEADALETQKLIEGAKPKNQPKPKGKGNPDQLQLPEK